MCCIKNQKTLKTYGVHHNKHQPLPWIKSGPYCDCQVWKSLGDLQVSPIFLGVVSKKVEPGKLLHMLSNEKRAPGWLGYIGDEILPSYIGIIS